MEYAFKQLPTLTFFKQMTQLYRRRPLLPPFLLVESVGMGVTSSIRPILIPARASARRADWAPGPGVFEPFPKQDQYKMSREIQGKWKEKVPPVARILICRAVIPSSLHRAATSWAANIAAQGELSSRSAFTFIPPNRINITPLKNKW